MYVMQPIQEQECETNSQGKTDDTWHQANCLSVRLTFSWVSSEFLMFTCVSDVYLDFSSLPVFSDIWEER